MKNLTLFLALVLFAGMIACKPEGRSAEEIEKARADSIALAAEEAARLEAERAAAEAAAAEAKRAAAHTHYESHHTKQATTTKSAPAKSAPVAASAPIVHHEHATAPVEPANTSDPKGLADAQGYYFASAQWATFPGGQAALDKFLADNLKYPAQARDNSIEGTVFTALYVDEAGNVVDVQYPGKHLGYGLEDEVTRVVKTMPRWNPGSFNNTNVKSKFVIPVKFKLM